MGQIKFDSAVDNLTQRLRQANVKELPDYSLANFVDDLASVYISATSKLRSALASCDRVSQRDEELLKQLGTDRGELLARLRTRQ